MPKNTIHVYACGGAGINRAISIELPINAAGFATPHTTLIDTSTSNLPKQLPSNFTQYMIPGVDGAGKNRGFAHNVSTAHLDKILTENKPGDVNVVIFSMSGGSGSVIGPMLIKRLLERDCSVISLGIANLTSAVEANNTRSTLLTLSNISSNVTGVPLVCGMYENTSMTPRSAVDAKIDNDLRAIAMLCSGENIALDKMDIYNWLHFNKITTVPSQLVELHVDVVTIENEPHYSPDYVNVISTASVLHSQDLVEPALNQAYGCVGYLSPATLEASDSSKPSLHFILSNANLVSRLENYEAILKSFKEKEAATAAVKLIDVPVIIGADKDGFII